MGFQEVHVDPSEDVRNRQNRIDVEVSVEGLPERTDISYRMAVRRVMRAADEDGTGLLRELSTAMLNRGNADKGPLRLGYSAYAPSLSFEDFRATSYLLPSGCTMCVDVGKHGPQVRTVNDRKDPAYWNHVHMLLQDGNTVKQSLSHYGPGNGFADEIMPVGKDRFFADMDGLKVVAQEMCDRAAVADREVPVVKEREMDAPEAGSPDMT